MTADAKEMCGWLNAQLGKHERVKEVVIRDSLPKTMIGKLDRKTVAGALQRFGIDPAKPSPFTA